MQTAPESDTLQRRDYWNRQLVPEPGELLSAIGTVATQIARGLLNGLALGTQRPARHLGEARNIEAGSVNTGIMTAMDVLPTLASAADVPLVTRFESNGRNLRPALSDGRRESRKDLLFFASETPIRGHFKTT